MFNKDFYPTPPEVIAKMIEGTDIDNKIILEPSAGKGNIIDYLKNLGAKSILSCELNADLATICKQKSQFLKPDFFDVESSEISHINLIIMNPPFSNADKHILHAFEIAPAGCKIISLCNYSALKNDYSQTRKQLKTLIDQYGRAESIDDVFKDAERQTGVITGMVIIEKPADQYEQEFDGFFMEEDEQPQENGVIGYNVIQDLVSRYVAAVKIFDRQLTEAVKMKELTAGYYSCDIAMSVTEGEKPTTRNEFKKAMQKSGWNFIFNKMNLQKYATRGLRDDINKFIEEQQHIPFTMKNIYVMIETIIGTTGQRMDKALLEVFDQLTKHYHENRYNVEGWKTNSHYMLNEKFILNNLVQTDYDNSSRPDTNYSTNFERVEDMIKAICFLTGDNYDDMQSLYEFINSDVHVIYKGKRKGFRHRGANDYDLTSFTQGLTERGTPFEFLRETKEFGKWYDWGYFNIRCYKKGTIHFKFKDRELWARFNQRIAKLKGYPLFEHVPKTEKKKTEPEILGSFDFAK